MVTKRCSRCNLVVDYDSNSNRIDSRYPTLPDYLIDPNKWYLPKEINNVPTFTFWPKKCRFYSG